MSDKQLKLSKTCVELNWFLLLLFFSLNTALSQPGSQPAGKLAKPCTYHRHLN